MYIKLTDLHIFRICKRASSDVKLTNTCRVDQPEQPSDPANNVLLATSQSEEFMRSPVSVQRNESQTAPIVKTKVSVYIDGNHSSAPLMTIMAMCKPWLQLISNY